MIKKFLPFLPIITLTFCTTYSKKQVPEQKNPLSLFVIRRAQNLLTGFSAASIIFCAAGSILSYLEGKTYQNKLNSLLKSSHHDTYEALESAIEMGTIKRPKSSKSTYQHITYPLGFLASLSYIVYSFKERYKQIDNNIYLTPYEFLGFIISYGLGSYIGFNYHFKSLKKNFFQ